MPEQKAFYEIEKPKKVVYTIIVKPEAENCECGNPTCTNDEAEYGEVDIDVWQCDCCGQWFCIDHISQKSDLCDICETLPPGIRAMTETFREELNS